MKDKWVNLLDHAVEYSLYGLILFIPISKSAIEIFFGFAALFFLLKKILKPDFKFLKSIHHIFLLLFVFFCSLSLFNSAPYFYRSLKTLCTKWLELILIFLIIEDTLSRPLRIRNAVTIFLSVSIIIGIDGLSQGFLGIEFLRQREMVYINQGFYGMTAAFENYNGLGTYLNFVLLLAIALLMSVQLKRIYRSALFFIIILLGACFLLTFSRASWLAFLLGLTLMLFLSRRTYMIFSIMCIFILLLFYFTPSRERALYVFQTHGTSERFLLLKIGWRMFMENPFLGKGIGTFMNYCSQYTSGLVIRYAHNCYLQILAETGVFALISFLLFVGFLLYKSVKTLRKNFDFLLLGLISAIFGFLVQSSLDVQFYSLQLATMFWAFLGLLVALIKIENRGI